MASVAYYTLAETAELLKVHPQTVRRWIRERRLPAQRFGKHYRVRLDDIQQAGVATASAAPAERTGAAEADEGDEFDRLSLAGLHDLWDNDADSIYDDWRTLYGIQSG